MRIERFGFYLASSLMITLMNCDVKQNNLPVNVFETSANGNKLKRIAEFPSGRETVSIQLLPGQKFQTITGFGGSFTEASAYLLNKLSKKKRDLILDAYFGAKGSRYSLTRTHINSCDFSLGNYSYAPVKGDMELEHFSIDKDRKDIIPMIRDAMTHSEDGFKIIAS
ncbi:MAG: glycosyl hydrolase family 30, partial [Bacteroidetes bacterium]|nr:glycosyl hydrolase family 30 [Bacteroidota bacterium]